MAHLSPAAVKTIKVLFAISMMVSLGYFVNATDFQKSILSIRLIGTDFWIPMVISFSAYLAASIGWKYCFAERGATLPFHQLFIIRQIGETVSLINPLGIIGGEAVKISLLKNKGVKEKKAVASIVISRVLMAITQLVLFALVAVAFLINSTRMTMSGQHFISLSVVMIALVIPFYLLLYAQNLKPIHPVYKSTGNFSRKESLFSKYWMKRKSIQSEICLFYHRDRKAIGWASFYFMIHWLAGSMEFYFLLKFLGVHITFAQSMFMDMGVVLFKSAGAFIPAQVGIEEYGNKIMLGLVGVAGIDIWITVSLLRRLRQLVWIGIGLVFYLLLQFKHRTVLQPLNGYFIRKP